MAQILGTGYQRAGKASAVSVTGTLLAYASWKLGMKIPDYPTTNFSSFSVAAQQSFDEGISGPLGCDISFGGDWDAHNNPLGTPGLYPRDDLPTVLFIENRTDAVQWSFPYMRVRGSNNSAEMTGKVAFDVSGLSQGIFTFPVGSV